MKIEITPDDLFELKRLQARLQQELGLEQRRQNSAAVYSFRKTSETERELEHNFAVLGRIIRSAS